MLPNTLRRQVQNFPDFLPVWREGGKLKLPLAAVAIAAHIAGLYRQGLTTPEVAQKLREGLPDPANTLRHDPTTVLLALVNTLERQTQVLERIGEGTEPDPTGDEATVVKSEKLVAR